MINVKNIVKHLPGGKANDPGWVSHFYKFNNDDVIKLNDEEQDNYNTLRYIFDQILEHEFSGDRT